LFIDKFSASYGDKACTLRGVEYYDGSSMVVTIAYRHVACVSAWGGYPHAIELAGGSRIELHGANGADTAAEIARRLETA
jgi:hypothetical protein